MKVSLKFMNGLVFGVSHQYYVDLDAVAERGTSFEEKMQIAPRVPMVFLFLGPLHFIITW